MCSVNAARSCILRIRKTFRISPRSGLFFVFTLLLQRFCCYAAFLKQRSCNIFVDKRTPSMKKQRSCDISSFSISLNVNKLAYKTKGTHFLDAFSCLKYIFYNPSSCSSGLFPSNNSFDGSSINSFNFTRNPTESLPSMIR